MRQASIRHRAFLGIAKILGFFALVTSFAGCGGGGGSPPEIDPRITITTQPVDQSVASGADAAFSVVATTTGPAISYQWQQSLDGGSSWTAITGSTASSCTLSTVSAAMDGRKYRVSLSSGTTAVTSAAATLTVLSRPAITTQPADQSVAAGSPVSVSVVATGGGLVYQWQSSTDGITFVDLAGANGASYSIASTTPADNGRRLRVVVTNGVGSITSSSALLTVLPAGGGTRYVYASSGHSIFGFSVDAATGVLSSTPGSPYAAMGGTNGGVSQMVIDPSGRFLYATTTGDGGTAAYAINPGTGELSALAGSPFAPGVASVTTTMHPRGQFLYLDDNSSGISGFRIDATTGALTLIPGSPFLARQLIVLSRMVIDPTGKFAFRRGVSGTLHALKVDPVTGALVSAPGSPYSGALSADPVVDGLGHYLFAAAGSAVNGYAIDGTSGALTALTPFAAGASVVSVLAHQNGKCLFVGAGANTLALLIDPTSGGLFSAGTSLATSGASLVFGAGQSYFYVGSTTKVLDFNARAVDIDASNCTISLASGSTFNPGNLLGWGFDPAGHYAFGALPASPSPGLGSYTIDPVTHAWVLVPGSPFASGTGFGVIVVR